MTAPVFISHSSKDLSATLRICTALEDRGVACWVASRDVGPGENYQRSIVRALRAARMMVLVVTENANTSPEIEKELALASQLGLAVIPVRVEDVVPSEALTYELATRQWINLFENWDREIDRLTMSIGRALAIDTKVDAGKVSLQPQPPTAPPPTTETRPIETTPVPAPRTGWRPAEPKPTPPPRAETRPVKPTPAPPPRTETRRPDPPAKTVSKDPPPAPVGVVIPPPKADPAPSNKPMPAEDFKGWPPIAAMVIVCVAAIIAALLHGDTFLPAWRDSTTWLLPIVSVLTLIAMISGLVLFCAEAARDTLQRLTITVGAIASIWIIFGYSVTFTGGNEFIGGFSKAFLHGIAGAWFSTFTVGVTIAEPSYVAFQGCVAAIAPALVIAAFGRQMKLAAIVLFVPLWAMLVYFPITHMAWYWTGPDEISDAAKALAAATDAAAKTAAQAKLDDLLHDAGWVFKKAFLDFAGGAVLAINAGIAALIGLSFLGDNKTGAPPKNPDAMSGKCALGILLMWLAWFSINACSDLDFGDQATRIAMVSGLSATAASAIAGLAMEWIIRRRSSMHGVLYGGLAGIVAATPASGFSGIYGAIVLGLCAGILAMLLVNASRERGPGAPGDIPVIYLASGILGTLATGILVNPALGGTGVFDYTTAKVADYDLPSQMIAQFWGVGTVLLWSGIGSAILYKIIDQTLGLRSSPQDLPPG